MSDNLYVDFCQQSLFPIFEKFNQFEKLVQANNPQIFQTIIPLCESVNQQVVGDHNPTLKQLVKQDSTLYQLSLMHQFTLQNLETIFNTLEQSDTGADGRVVNFQYLWNGIATQFYLYAANVLAITQNHVSVNQFKQLADEFKRLTKPGTQKYFSVTLDLDRFLERF